MAIYGQGASATPPTPLAAPGEPTTTRFSSYPDLATSTKIAERSLTPLTYQRLQMALLRSGQRLDEQPLRLPQETFVLYVPKTPPPTRGYGLLAFISPSALSKLPFRWASVLDRQGVIFVSAMNAGNAENILTRREPLALIAALNVSAAYPVDKSRIYLGGFSGGSRVAMRLALDFPDLFSGVILNAGSDPIGDAVTPLPSQDLLKTFQLRSRLVYLTGAQDEANVGKDSESRQSMDLWCVFNTTTLTMPYKGHDIADALFFARALSFLERPPNPPSRRLAACQTSRQAELREALAESRRRLAAKDPRAAALIHKIDARFGGLAAPDSPILAAMGGP